MDLVDLLGLILLVASSWLWYDSLKAREMAVFSARAACSSENLLLLDDTVAIQRISLGRDGEGVQRLRRIYAFEYSDTGNDRNAGSIVLLGNRVMVINLNLRGTPLRTLLH